MGKVTLKTMRDFSRHNIIKKLMKEEKFEWIIFHPNVKLLYISSMLSLYLTKIQNKIFFSK